MNRYLWLAAVLVLPAVGACGSGDQSAAPRAPDETATVAQAFAPMDYPVAWAEVQSAGVGSGAPSNWFSSMAGRTTPLVTSTSPGFYRVDFPQLTSTSGGNVQVSAEGGTPARCEVQSWGATTVASGAYEGVGLSVWVACSNFSGTLVPSPFVVLFQAAPASGVHAGTELAYLWSNELTGPFTPSAAYQWSSTGGGASVQWVATGEYLVTLTGMNDAGGSAFTTAYGSSGEYCNPGYWYASGGNTIVDVRCFSFAGAPQNSLFTLVYSQAFDEGVEGVNQSYAWASSPTVGSYSPGAYEFDAEGPITITRQGTGSYLLAYPITSSFAVSLWGAPFVVSYGSTGNYCEIGASGSTENDAGTEAVVSVTCFSPSGALADTQFEALLPQFEVCPSCIHHGGTSGPVSPGGGSDVPQ